MIIQFAVANRLRQYFLSGLTAVMLSLMALPVTAQTLTDTAGDAGPEQAETLKPLIDLLRDDKTREAVLAELERLAGEKAPAEEVEPAPKTSIARQIARITQEGAETIGESVDSGLEQLQQVPRLFDGLSGVELSFLLGTLTDLGLVIAATVGSFLILRMIARRVDRMMGAAASEKGALGTGLLITGSVLLDTLAVASAWALGYLLALTVIGDAGSIGIRQTLYLNAFMLIELTKVALRTILSPNTPDLRLLNMPNAGARKTYRVLAWVTSLVGYGHLLIVPIVSQQVTPFAGQGVSALIMLVSIVVLVTMIVRKRHAVTDWMLGEDGEKSGIWAFFVRRWHIVAIAYLLLLGLLVISQPPGVLTPFLISSATVLAAIVGGAIAAGMLSRSISSGVHLPATLNNRLPLLERRLNSFIPSALWVLRAGIILSVIFFSLHTIGLVDLRGWIESQVGVDLTATLVGVSLILLASFTLWLAISSWIDFRLNPEFGRVATAREQTLLSLLRNAATIVIVVITLMFVLSEMGIDIAPLIASAGVLGLAIGFGAQKMVQDIITGVFIQFENAMNVGDVVTVGGTTGTVERLTIRSVSLRDVEGVFHIIPFSSVDMVSNYMREFGNFVCDMGIAYRENIDDAKQAMQDGFEELRANPNWKGSIMGDLQWFGLQSFGDSAVVVRARIKCYPGQQWGVGRAYNEILKRIFDERGIEIPFPHQTIYLGEDREGNAPPLNVKLNRRSET